MILRALNLVGYVRPHIHLSNLLIEENKREIQKITPYPDFRTESFIFSKGYGTDALFTRYAIEGGEYLSYEESEIRRMTVFVEQTLFLNPDGSKFLGTKIQSTKENKISQLKIKVGNENCLKRNF